MTPLEFVGGAIPTNESVLPIFTHFLLYNERVQASNGRIVLDSPLPGVKLDACVPADRFYKAMQPGAKIDMHVTEGGRLSIKRGRFRALLPLMPSGDFPAVAIQKKQARFKLTPGFTRLLENIRPFIGDDATRPWVSNTLFHSGRLITTSNVCITAFDAKGIADFTIPLFAVEELLRIADEPFEYALDGGAIYFFWKGDRWLKSQTIEGEWPIKTVHEYLATPTKPKKLPEGLADAVEELLPFCADPKHPVVFFNKDGISTAPGDTQAEVEGFTLEPICFDARNLLPILKHATKAELRSGERPVGFFYGPGGFVSVLSGLKL